MTALGKDERYKFADSDAGRAKVMEYLNGRIADMRKRLPRAFATLVPGNMEIKRMAPEVEPGAPGAYGGPGTIDGKVPGKFWINLGTMDNWTTYNLRDTRVPRIDSGSRLAGRVHVQAAAAALTPRVQRVLGRLGTVRRAACRGTRRLRERSCRPPRLSAVDRLPRVPTRRRYRPAREALDSASRRIEWFATTNGSSVGEVTSEVDRYCAWPGQACGYKVGHSEINRLRKKAQAALGAKFDLRQFDDAVVTGGGVPMVVLARNIDAFIAKHK